ncbi:hypothetical protein [Bradyrhizobium sp. DOA1]|uniref:hypothetical protein n=1 Tax=Bradyrhizobium sp. DOA1 TaxID=1126616 RepID=UPI0012E926A6|nr:hypothetical protein [Bradyrhizobium sp. DOA1]
MAARAGAIKPNATGHSKPKYRLRMVQERSSLTMVAASAILLRLIQQSPRKKAEHASAETVKPSDRLSAHNARRVGCYGDTIREVLGFGDTAASSHSLEDDVDVCHCSKPVRPTLHQMMIRALLLSRKSSRGSH